MRIGKFAAFAGTNASTIRYYEQIGLLPAPKRIGSNHRHYGEADVARLGFTLEQIRQFAKIAQSGGDATDQCRKIVQARLMSVRVRIEEMKAVERRLAGMIAGQAARIGSKTARCTKLAVLA